jgi:metal-dependent amidase/aminoacylase/carboxypeptidase family protein
MHRILKGITEAHGATLRDGIPQDLSEHPKQPRISSPPRCHPSNASCGEKNVIELIPGMGGEDFSYFAQVVPGFYFRLGVANEEKGIILRRPHTDV